jgi:hypothetical protein
VTQDGRRLEIARFFATSEDRFMGLAGDGYSKFRDLISRLARCAEIANLASEKCVDQILFNWVRDSFHGTQIEPFSKHLTQLPQFAEGRSSVFRHLG